MRGLLRSGSGNLQTACQGLLASGMSDAIWCLHHIVECKSSWMGPRSLRHERGRAGCCRPPEPQLSQTEVNHVSSLVTIQNLVSNLLSSVPALDTIVL